MAMSGVPCTALLRKTKICSIIRRCLRRESSLLPRRLLEGYPQLLKSLEDVFLPYETHVPAQFLAGSIVEDLRRYAPDAILVGLFRLLPCIDKPDLENARVPLFQFFQDGAPSFCRGRTDPRRRRRGGANFGERAPHLVSAPSKRPHPPRLRLTQGGCRQRRNLFAE